MDNQQAGPSPEDAWQIRQRKRQAQREAAVQSMREICGGRPNAATQAAINQRQNRLEHSR